MRTPKISVLVPVYNVEPYLWRFIDSVLAQDFQDWEMILVDDGSPDRCPGICDEAARRDDRIRVVHKENGGLLSARKTGVNNANGHYYVFWDSDDTVPPDALSILYSHITKGYDVVRASGLRVAPNGDLAPLETYSFKGEINDAEDYLKYQFIGDIAPYLWNGIYSANLFDDSIYDTSIKNHISVGEDWVTNLIVGLRIKKALVCDDIVYHYYYNPASYMGSTVFTMSYQTRVDSVLSSMGVLKVPKMEFLFNRKHYCDIIIKFFIPELGFSVEDYYEVRSFLSNDGTLADLRQMLPSKFLYFITSLPLYYLYTRLYCLLYGNIKLHGRKRKVIR